MAKSHVKKIENMIYCNILSYLPLSSLKNLIITKILKCLLFALDQVAENKDIQDILIVVKHVLALVLIQTHAKIPDAQSQEMLHLTIALDHVDELPTHNKMSK